MLDMVSAHHSLPFPVMYHLVGQAMSARKACVHSSSIATKHGILVNQRRQDRLHMLCIER